jgi:hypothetical protein
MSAAFRPRGAHGETLGKRGNKVETPTCGAQTARGDEMQRRHPGDYRQRYPLVKSLTSLSEQLFKTPPPKKTPPSIVRANPQAAARRMRS